MLSFTTYSLVAVMEFNLFIGKINVIYNINLFRNTTLYEPN